MSEYERWEKRFSEPGYLFGTAPNAFLASKADLLRTKAGGTALSVADGEGRNGVFLAELGLDVLSLDLSPTAQEKARKLAAQRGVRLRLAQGDVTDWEWPAATFDVVVGIFFQFAEPQARDAIFAGMKRALKPGGLLLLEGYRPEQLKYNTGGPKDEAQLYTRAMLEGAFGDLATLEIDEHDSAVNEGGGHAGMSALIDLVASKATERGT
jgi:SAM-dependent methyltransferase